MNKFSAILNTLKNIFKRSDSSATANVVQSDGVSVPAHVAIIMDGNNRWAKQQKLAGISGHKVGVESIRRVLSVCEERGVKVLTLFAFSSENWQRPEAEVLELMRLLKTYLQNEVDELHQRGARVRFIGRRDRLDADIVDLMNAAEQKTQGNSVSNLVLAIDYGGRWDIADATRAIASKVVDGSIGVDEIDEGLLGQHIAMSDLPAPDLCIRTGAEHRLSNFLLWQLSYAELYFCDCYWPDFDEAQFRKALLEFGIRQRRFGQTGVQLEQRSLAGKNSGEACQDNALGLDTANVNHSDTNVGPRNA